MVVRKKVLILRKSLNECSLTAFVAGITSISFNNVHTSEMRSFCTSVSVLQTDVLSTLGVAKFDDKISR